jgi:hypothetical protein
MAFQSTVFIKQGFGVIGELYTDGPHRAQSYILNSADPANNVFGRAFTVIAQGEAQAGIAAPAPYAGILVNPKTHALRGDGVSTLNPSLTLPNFAQADIASMGTIVVTFGIAANVGDLVVYDNVTGILSPVAPAAALPAGTSFAQAVVDYYDITSGLATITLDPTLVAPV